MSRQVIQLFQVTPAAVYVAVIFLFGSLPPGSDALPNLNDKLMHAVAFGGLVPLNLLAAAALLTAWSLRTRLLAAAGVAIALGGLLEVHQLFFTRRSAELGDWLADTVGVVVIAALLAAYLARRPTTVAPTSER